MLGFRYGSPQNAVDPFRGHPGLRKAFAHCPPAGGRMNSRPQFVVDPDGGFLQNHALDVPHRG